MTPPDVAALLARHPEPWWVGTFGRVSDGQGDFVFDADGEAYEAKQLLPLLATALRAALADQRRYQWLKQTDEATLCATAYRVWAACEFDTADACIDAAMTADGGGV